MKTLIVLSDGNTYEVAGEAVIVRVSDEEFARIEAGKSVKNVVDLPERGELLFEDLEPVLKNMTIDKDNYGQVILYTGLKFDDDGRLVEMEEDLE